MTKQSPRIRAMDHEKMNLSASQQARKPTHPDMRDVDNNEAKGGIGSWKKFSRPWLKGASC